MCIRDSIGTGFIRNYQKWQELCVNMDTICANEPVDTSFTLFGRTVDLPVFAAPVGALTLHYGDKYSDQVYNDILVAACAKAGIAAFTGDGTDPSVMEGAAAAIAKKRCIRDSPYTACERGTNENINRMIRRHFPKGTDFGKVTAAEVKRVERWINTYPREILGFSSSVDMFAEAFGRAS